MRSVRFCCYNDGNQILSHTLSHFQELLFHNLCLIQSVLLRRTKEESVLKRTNNLTKHIFKVQGHRREEELSLGREKRRNRRKASKLGDHWPRVTSQGISSFSVSSSTTKKKKCFSYFWSSKNFEGRNWEENERKNFSGKCFLPFHSRFLSSSFSKKSPLFCNKQQMRCPFK